jgi:hypothetical protein
MIFYFIPTAQVARLRSVDAVDMDTAARIAATQERVTGGSITMIPQSEFVAYAVAAQTTVTVTRVP